MRRPGWQRSMKMLMTIKSPMRTLKIIAAP